MINDFWNVCRTRTRWFEMDQPVATIIGKELGPMSSKAHQCNAAEQEAKNVPSEHRCFRQNWDVQFDDRAPSDIKRAMRTAMFCGRRQFLISFAETLKPIGRSCCPSPPEDQCFEY